MKPFWIVRIFLFSSLISLAQNQKETDFYKSKFFQMEAIGTDSTLWYVEKIFLSKHPIDQAFAYTAKRQILFLTGVKYSDVDYLKKIDFNLKKVDKKKDFYEEIAKIYNINANTFFNKKNSAKALEYYLKGLEYAVLINDVKLIIKIKSNIVTIKGDNGLEKEAIQDLLDLRELLISHKKQYSKEDYEKQFFLNNLNLGVYYSNLYRKEPNEDYYNQSKNYLDLALDYSKQEDINKAIVYKNIGVLNTHSNQLDSSIAYYNKAIKIYKQHNLINEVYYLRKNCAIDYYDSGRKDLAKPIFIKNVKEYDSNLIPDDYYLYNLLYLSKIYEDEKQQDSMAFYSKSFFELYDKKNHQEKFEFVEVLSKIKENDLVKLKTNVVELEKRYTVITIIYFLLLVVVIAILSLIIKKQIRLRKQNEKKIEELIDNVKEKIKRPSDNQINFGKITNQKEQEIIAQLIKLEKANYFLRKDFDRYTVARKIDSNTTYLSQVINSYKNMTFNEYTNDLRINYVLKALLEDSKLRGYTIQAIAESIGYKNGISFSKIFRKKTGITPYQYIERINKGL